MVNKVKFVLKFSVQLMQHIQPVNFQVKLRGTYRDKTDAGLDSWQAEIVRIADEI